MTRDGFVIDAWRLPRVLLLNIFFFHDVISVSRRCASAGNGMTTPMELGPGFFFLLSLAGLEASQRFLGGIGAPVFWPGLGRLAHSEVPKKVRLGPGEFQGDKTAIFVSNADPPISPLQS